MKNLWQSLTDYAFIIMGIGMAVGICGLIILIQAQNAGNPRGIGTGIGIAGIVIYVLGRIAHASKSRYSQKKKTSHDTSDEL